MMKKVLLLTLYLLAAEATTAGENLALGKSCRFLRPANYKLCADRADATQLTDGVYAPTEGQLWTKRECVGWSLGRDEGVITVTVDLGAPKALGGFSWHYAAGSAGVGWPSVIFVYASEDGKTWDCVGDLLAMSVDRDGGPQVDRYRDYRAWSKAMPAWGRYVTFAVKAEAFVFCDELEVYAGDPTNAAAVHESALKVESPVRHLFCFQVRDRVMRDLKDLGGEGDAALSAEVKDLVSQDVRDTKTVLPLNAVHGRVWALNVRQLAAAGFSRPVFWRSNRWDNLNPLAIPTEEAVSERSVDVEMMRGEVRSEAINLLNPTSTSLACTLTVEELPAQANVRCYEVAFTDTRGRIVTSAALLPGVGRQLRLSLPAGASRQIWISFDRPTVAAGSYRGTVQAEIATVGTLRYPIRLRIADLDFPDRARLHVYGWDYTLSGKQPMSEAFRIEHRARMRELGMDVPWETFSVLPQNPKFSADGSLENADGLDFARLDRWLAYFPDAVEYAVFLASESRKNKANEFVFFGEKVGTPRFDRMAGCYFRAVADRMIAQGRREEQLMLCFVDEPGEWKTDWTRLGELVNRWSVAVHATCPKAVLFQDPTYKDTSAAPQGYWESSDIYCPMARALLENAETAAFFRKLRQTGKTLFVYSCDGPSRTLDPLAYYRLISYVAFRNGASGIGFWAFGHAPGMGCDSWHAYSQTGVEYSPYFIGADGAAMTKQSEGIREGVEDYEYLSLLADRIRADQAAGRDVSSCRALIRDGVEHVLAVCRERNWAATNDRTAMDELRVRVLHELEK